MANKVQRKFVQYDDPGHGWVKVPVKLLIRLGILNEITRWSYQRGTFAYLEEDQDKWTFIFAYERKFGFRPEISWTHTDRDSKIRNYESYDYRDHLPDLTQPPYTPKGE